MQPTALNMSGLFQSISAQQIQERLHSVNLSILVCGVCVWMCNRECGCICVYPQGQISGLIFIAHCKMRPRGGHQA